MKIFLTALAFIALSFTYLQAYSDFDMDGVADRIDKCPDSSFEDIVDADGCANKHSFFLALGTGQNSGDYGTGNTINGQSSDILLGYGYNSWYASVASSYQSSGVENSATGALDETSGQGDTYIGLGYTHFLHSGFSLYYQANVKLPTADDGIGTGKTDIGASLTAAYYRGRWTYFALAGHTLTGDDSKTVYNDISSYSLGIGKMLNESFYISAAANHSDPLLDGSDAVESLSVFANYHFTQAWSASLSYSYGLTDATADSSLNAMIGVSF